MTFELTVILVLVVVVALIATVYAHKKVPKKIKPVQFEEKWKEIQAQCKDRSMWPEVVTSADVLLDKALKRRRYKGKSMGERMVSAQRDFTNNDGVWFAHNLSKKIVASDGELKLKEPDVKNALVGFRQALRDLGALPNGENKNS